MSNPATALTAAEEREMHHASWVAGVMIVLIIVVVFVLLKCACNSL